MNFGCHGNVKFSLTYNGKSENWDLLLSHCRYFDKNFTEMFFEWPSTKDTFLYPATKTWRGIMLYPPNRFECPSVYPSVCPSALRFRTNLSSFWLIFLKLCMVGEECFGIADGLNSFIYNRVMALEWCKNLFFLNIFRTNRWILTKFYRCIDIYKIHVVSKERFFCLFFWSIFNRVAALDWHQNFVYAQYLVNKFVDFDQILYMHWYWQDVDLNDWTIVFVHFQQSYGPWLMSKYHLCSISWEPIDEFW